MLGGNGEFSIFFVPSMEDSNNGAERENQMFYSPWQMERKRLLDTTRKQGRF